MTESGSSHRVLYVIGCAAPPVLEIADLIRRAQARDWDVCLILTPTAAVWLEEQLPELAALTGHPVRSQYKQPGEPDVLPPADALLVAPASFNTVNKWAAGIADTLALGVITEGVGKPVRLVALPHVNGWQGEHSAFRRSVGLLRGDGVDVVLGEDLNHRKPFPWDLGLDALQPQRD